MRHTFQNWLCIGRTDQVQNAGAYIAKNIINEPIVVVNIGDGKLAAYYNVCRHHAAQICDEGVGQLDPVRKVSGRRALWKLVRLLQLLELPIGKVSQHFVSMGNH